MEATGKIVISEGRLGESISWSYTEKISNHKTKEEKLITRKTLKKKVNQQYHHNDINISCPT